MSSIRQFFTLNLLILAMAATAQSGALDPGFSGDGIATLDGGTNTFDLFLGIGDSGRSDPGCRVDQYYRKTQFFYRPVPAGWHIG